MAIITRDTIDRLLILKNKSQKDLASAAGIDEKTFSARKKTGKFSEEEISKMATFLGVDEDELLGELRNVGIKDLYMFLAQTAAKQDGMMRVLLSAVSELLAEQRRIPEDEMRQRIIKAVNLESVKNLEKLQ